MASSVGVMAMHSSEATTVCLRVMSSIDYAIANIVRQSCTSQPTDIHQLNFGSDTGRPTASASHLGESWHLAGDPLP